MSDRSTRPRGRATPILTVVFGVLAVLALAAPMWIEDTAGLSPDGGNGELEAFLAVPFGVAALTCRLLRWRSRRQHLGTQQDRPTP